MSYREISMLEVKEVLRRKEEGRSARQIAKEMNLDRKTVGRYVDAIEEAGIGDGTEVDEEVLSAILRAVQGQPELSPSEAWLALGKQRVQIEQWLGKVPPLRLVRVHELLKRKGVKVGYTTLRRYAKKELGWHKRPPTVLLSDPPYGEEAQIDFGQMGMVTDEGCRRRKLHVLIVTLSKSRYQFVWPSYAQTVEEVCAGLDAAWKFFEGVVKRVVLDNATSMVVRASSTEPELNRSFREYADARGFLVDPARVRSPKDKPRVENQVAYVRERWFAGETLPSDLPQIRRHAEAWCRDVAGARVHGTTRKVPRVVYETQEKPHMLPAPTEPYDLPSWSDAKVHPDHHLQAHKALYSVPTRYIGKTVKVRCDQRTVRVYLGTELLKVHPRKGPGERSTDPSDFPPHKAPYALRDVDSLVRRAKEQGSAVGAFCEQLLGGPLPWVKLRQAQGLLRLCERYGNDRVNALCARALAFGVIQVPRLERMLKEAQSVEDEGEKQGQVVRLPARFAREDHSFATRTASPLSTTVPATKKGGA
jgi:transposase